MLLYTLFISCYLLLIRLAAFFGNEKAKSWLSGRKNQQTKNRFSLTDKVALFHCASLGEFEQGRELLEQFKSRNPHYKIVLTFFSPSGFDVRKNYELADAIFYLPADRKKDVKIFLDDIHPDIVFIIKYEFWLNFLFELKKIGTPVFLVSAIFRPQQIFFKWYGSLFRKGLQSFTHIFLQDNYSQKLLNDINVHQCSVAGDTRFDRVLRNFHLKKDIPEIEKFKKNDLLLVAGSTWPADEELLLKTHQRLKAEGVFFRLILVPHVINQNEIIQKQKSITNCILYSQFENGAHDVMIVDAIGLLSSIYRYADVAFIGGGFNAGIHNTLEAAVFGLPVVFGPRYEKFNEAVKQVELKTAFSLRNEEELYYQLKKLFSDKNLRDHIREKQNSFVMSDAGATEKILQSSALNSVDVR